MRAQKTHGLMNTTVIVSFWKWFESVSDALFQNNENFGILSELDTKVKTLGPFDWEVGPVDDNLIYLAISPRLNEEYLTITKEIVSYAPSCKGWWILYAKPRKEYAPVFNMVNENGKSILVDISVWEYVLFLFEDGTFDIDLRISTIDGNLETKNLAVDVVLTSLMGEERFMALIKNIRIVDNFGENEKQAIKLKQINEHIEKIVK
jgi:hypothetical protein